MNPNMATYEMITNKDVRADIEEGFARLRYKGCMRVRRVKDKVIVVRPTDKSHKLCVCTWDNYLEQGKSHTEKDRRVN